MLIATGNEYLIMLSLLVKKIIGDQMSKFFHVYI